MKDILISGLERLEYRGYDSAGIAVEEEDGLQIVHRKGKVASLAHTVDHFDFAGTCGIGHTRWATHGRPSEANAHPHASCDGHIAVVHNGIIENFTELREELEAEGHAFTSDTDTETIAHLVEELYEDDLLEAVREATQRLIGAYAIAVISDREPGTIIAARKDSPLVVGRGTDGSFVASDIIALIDDTRDVVMLGDGEIAKLRPDFIDYYNAYGERFVPQTTHIDWDVDVAEKGGYPDFMMKEIHEQPRVIRDTLSGRLADGRLSIDELDLTHEELNLIDRVYVIACGTSYHAGLIAKNLIEGWARIPCRGGGGERVPLPQPHRHAVRRSWWPCRSPARRPTRWPPSATRASRAPRCSASPTWWARPVARESRRRDLHRRHNKEIAVAATKIASWARWRRSPCLAMLLAQLQRRASQQAQVRLLVPRDGRHRPAG